MALSQHPCWKQPPARPSLSQHVFTQLYLMTALLQHSALNSRALAASDKYSKSNRPVFALRLPDRPTARHRSTLTGLCHPKTLSNRHPRPPVYRCKSLENKSRRAQIEVNEWYSGESNDGLIKGPGHHMRVRTYGEGRIGEWYCWQTPWRVTCIRWKLAQANQRAHDIHFQRLLPTWEVCMCVLPCSLVPDCFGRPDGGCCLQNYGTALSHEEALVPDACTGDEREKRDHFNALNQNLPRWLDQLKDTCFHTWLLLHELNKLKLC